MAQSNVEKPRQPLRLERLGRYRIVRPLSKGGMALVYEARRESLAGVAPRVAIKLILPEHAESDTFRELFKNEARLGANMHHQNLVQIQDFDQVGEHFFLVMEYVEGLNLRQVVSLCLRAGIEIPVGVIAEVGRQACDGLHYAHEATDERGVHLGLIHRDVKPSNLMLNPHGVIKILDFGISKGNLLAERSGAVRGTWGYMAPEQASGRGIGPNADVFGLATILYEMASRKPLFRKKSPEEIKRLLDDDHAARMAATLPPTYGPLVSVLVRGLQRDPVARYASAADFGRALSSLLPDPITARDEVVRFYRVVEAIEQGHPPPVHRSDGPVAPLPIPGPGASTSPTQDSIVAAPPLTVPRRFPLLPVLGGIAALTLVGLLGVLIGRALLVVPDDPGGAALLDLDEFGSDFVVRPDQPDPPQAARVDPESPAARPPPRTVPTAPSRVPPRTSGMPSPPSQVAVSPQQAETEPEPIEQPVVVEVDRRIPEIQIVEVEPAPSEQPQEPTAQAPPPDKPVAVGSGWVTLSAQPYGLSYDIFINGKLVEKAGPQAPVVRHQLPAGQHFVTISAAGARKQFQIELADQEHVRRVWDFERNAFRR